MALLSNTPSAIYLSISQGKIARRLKEPTSTSKTRTTKEGKLVHEELYDSLQGIITDISTKDGNYGRELLITISDDGEKAVLQLSLSSGPASSFLKALPNVNLTRPVTLRPKMETDGDKSKTTLFISQDGAGVKWYWTKDNPGKLPGLKKIKVKGKDTWDDSEQLDFFENYIATEIKPLLGKAEAVTAEADDSEEAPF